MSHDTSHDAHRDLAAFYIPREPVDVFRFAGRDRCFVAYDTRVIDELSARAEAGAKAEALYREICARVLRGDPDIRALPADSPPWFCCGGKWRPDASMVTVGHGT